MTSEFPATLSSRIRQAILIALHRYEQEIGATHMTTTQIALAAPEHAKGFISANCSVMYHKGLLQRCHHSSIAKTPYLYALTDKGRDEITLLKNHDLTKNLFNR